MNLAARRSTSTSRYSLGDTPFAGLGFISADERAVLAEEPLALRTLAPGTELLREGSQPESLYFLISGWAIRYITTRDGARQIPGLLVPGGVCNLDNLLFERADFGVRAITRMDVLALPRIRALALAAEHPGVGRAFTWLALAENAILSQWAVGLGRRTALQRLAHLLCETSVRLSSGDGTGGGNGEGACSFELPLTQEVIADVLGLTPVHVNRTMQQLRAQGYIVTAGRTITVTDFQRLQTLAEFDRSYLQQIERSAVSAPVMAD